MLHDLLVKSSHSLAHLFGAVVIFDTLNKVTMDIGWTEHYCMVEAREKQEGHFRYIITSSQYFDLAEDENEPCKLFDRLCRGNC